MAKKVKETMKQIASTGIYHCANCHNDVIMNNSCQVCGHKLRGFYFELEEYAEIQRFLGAKATNKLEIFIFGDQFYYSLKDGAGPKKVPKDAPKRAYKKRAPKVAPKKKLEF